MTTTLRPHQLTIDHVGKNAIVHTPEGVITGRIGRFDHDIDWITDVSFLSKHPDFTPGQTTTTFSVGSVTVTAEHRYDDIHIALVKETN